jgi:hypothetical protein
MSTRDFTIHSVERNFLIGVYAVIFTSKSVKGMNKMSAVQIINYRDKKPRPKSE